MKRILAKTALIALAGTLSATAATLPIDGSAEQPDFVGQPLPDSGFARFREGGGFQYGAYSLRLGQSH